MTRSEKPRNPVACSALMKMGGPHITSRTGMRQIARQALAQSLRELESHEVSRISDRETNEIEASQSGDPGHKLS